MPYHILKHKAWIKREYLILSLTCKQTAGIGFQGHGWKASLKCIDQVFCLFYNHGAMGLINSYTQSVNKNTSTQHK